MGIEKDLKNCLVCDNCKWILKNNAENGIDWIYLIYMAIWVVKL